MINLKIKNNIIGRDCGKVYGHPLVNFNLNIGGTHVYPYCSKIFFRK